MSKYGITDYGIEEDDTSKVDDADVPPFTPEFLPLELRDTVDQLNDDNDDGVDVNLRLSLIGLNFLSNDDTDIQVFNCIDSARRTSNQNQS